MVFKLQEYGRLRIDNLIQVMKNLKTLFRSNCPSAPLRRAKRISFSSLSKDELEKNYFGSRVYQDKSMAELINQIIVNKAVQSPMLVDHADGLYDLTRKLMGNYFCFDCFLTSIWNIGKELSSYVVKKTVGRVFTGGSTFEDVLVPTKAYNRQGNAHLSIIFTYLFAF